MEWLIEYSITKVISSCSPIFRVVLSTVKNNLFLKIQAKKLSSLNYSVTREYSPFDGIKFHAGATFIPWQDCFPILFISSYIEANTFIISNIFSLSGRSILKIVCDLMGSTVHAHEADWQQICTPHEYWHILRLLKLMYKSIDGWDKHSWCLVKLIDFLSGSYQIALVSELSFHLFSSP